MFDFDALKYDEKGLIPAIVVDSGSGKVLTLAYMNRESLRISMEKGLTCFWSRSRNELWLKGETSGNYQHIPPICLKRAWTRSSKKSGRSARRSSSPPRTGTSPIRSTSWRISPITRWC